MNGTDSILLAHVADSIERELTSDGLGHQDYDGNADLAAKLLDFSPELVRAAESYAHGDLNEADFDEEVRFAIDLYYEGAS